MSAAISRNIPSRVLCLGYVLITVTRNDEQRVYEALETEWRDAVQGDIDFFDTPELTLYEAAVVLRARTIEKDDDDSVVKIRPVEADKIDDKWRETDGFKLEAAVVGDKVVMSASLRAKQN